MLDKMMTSKTPVKKYDMNVVQGIRRGQFWASLFMCYTHLRKGMIKPMMLQVDIVMGRECGTITSKFDSSWKLWTVFTIVSKFDTWKLSTR